MNHQDICNIITAALPHGVLLNTQNTKFNSMVIGWGHAGIMWSVPTFVVYVRQSRYTKGALDASGAFTISAPLNGQRLSKEVFQICGSQSGRDVEKSELFTLVPGRKVNVPAIKEYPVTLECKVLYSQDQELERIPEEVKSLYYSQGTDVDDFHTAYIGQIVDAYVVE